MNLIKTAAIAAVSFSLTTGAFASNLSPTETDLPRTYTSSLLTPVIEPSDLPALTGKVSILDIRGDKKAFAEGHIPGSVQIGYGAFRGPKNNPGQLFEPTELAKALGAVGLEKEKGVVVVSAGNTSTDFGAAARVYWSLKSVGFENLAILNGGYKSYVADKLPISSGAVTVQPTELNLSFNDSWYSSTESIQSSIEAGSARLLDSRLPSFFEGKAWHGAAKKPGALPGAENFAFTAFFDDTKLKPAGEVNQIVAQNNLNQPQTVSYCNTGHWAATNWFVLSEVAQIPEVTLYAESMVEWSNNDLAMDNVPSAIEFAYLKSKKWFSGLLN